MKLAKLCWANAVAVGVVGVGFSGGVARAQSGSASGAGAAQGSSSLIASKPIPSLSFKMTPVQQITDAISRAAGVPIVTNSLVASAHIDFTTLGGSLDAVLTELAHVLPPSGSVRAVLLPNSSTPDALPDGDVVVAYLSAQDSLVKAAKSGVSAGGAAVADAAAKPSFVPGEFEALGRRIDADKAAALSAQMNLHPVYVVSVTRPPVSPVSKLAALQAEALRNYQGMTPDERKTAMENQFNDMMNMDKGARQALLGQMMDQGAYMVNAMKNMPPAQLQEYQSEMIAAMQNSGMAGALGGGGGAKGGGTGK